MSHIFLAGGLLIAVSACGVSQDAEAEGGDAAAMETPAATPAAAGATGDQTAAGDTDVLVPGTEYNATTVLKCGFDDKAPTQDCNAGIKRNWGEPGEHLIEVVKPDGRKRAIFFRGTEPYGADSAQSDGSAAWELKSTRKDDQVTVRFGPETYVIIDAMIEGG